MMPSLDASKIGGSEGKLPTAPPELKKQTTSTSGAAPASLRSTGAARERLEPLLAFLEDEHVLNPAYGLQYRRALTLEDKLEQVKVSPRVLVSSL